MVRCLASLERALGSPEAFQALLGIILADRGPELRPAEAIERSRLDPSKRRYRVFRWTKVRRMGSLLQSLRMIRNMSSKEMAEKLFVAESTVNSHLKSIYRKADVHSKRDLAKLAEHYRSAHM